MLRGQGAGHPPLGQARAGGQHPPGLQPSPGRRRPAVGVLQPVSLGVGAGVRSSTTSSGAGAKATTPPCARSATAGWRSCGTASSAASCTTRPPTSPPQPCPAQGRLTQRLPKSVSRSPRSCCSPPRDAWPDGLPCPWNGATVDAWHAEGPPGASGGANEVVLTGSGCRPSVGSGAGLVGGALAAGGRACQHRPARSLHPGRGGRTRLPPRGPLAGPSQAARDESCSA